MGAVRTPSTSIRFPRPAREASSQATGFRLLGNAAGAESVRLDMARRVLVVRRGSPMGAPPLRAGVPDAGGSTRRDGLEMAAVLAAMLGVLVIVAVTLGAGPLG